MLGALVVRPPVRRAVHAYSRTCAKVRVRVVAYFLTTTSSVVFRGLCAASWSCNDLTGEFLGAPARLSTGGARPGPCGRARPAHLAGPTRAAPLQQGPPPAGKEHRSIFRRIEQNSNKQLK